MIPAGVFPVEAWSVSEPQLNLEIIAQTESVFALSNGHIGLRGNLDEGEPHGIPGSYLAGFHELRPLPYAEAGYGYPESGQSVVDVTNGKLIRLLVEDEPLDVRYGRLVHHERALDLQAGLLRRSLEWISPAGSPIRVTSSRLVSFAHRAIAAIRYEVEAVDQSVRLIVQSELVANEEQPQTYADPRVAAALTSPLVAVSQDAEEAGAVLLHRTRRSGLLLGAGSIHEIEAPGRVVVEQDVRPDWARTTVASTLEPGQRLVVVKYLGYGWSGSRSVPAMRDQVAAALSGARFTGWEGLVEAQRSFLNEFWEGADVEVEGDPVLQQAVRFGLFHVLQAGARTEQRAIAAKGLTGPGYDGHSFWDTEGYVLPILSATLPSAARDALLWRGSTLEAARARAATLGLKGASFPWRTITGEECSGYWPAGTAGFHLNADIAYAIERYRVSTGDEAFLEDIGLEVLRDTARLWMSLGHHNHHGTWHLNGVTGPDEYTAVVDDNVFTNLMAARNLVAAAEGCRRHPQLAHDLGVTSEETALWRDAAGHAHVPYDGDLLVHPQCEGFTRYREWDFEAYRDKYPLLLHAPYVLLYRSQVVKQADLVLATHWCGDQFTAEDKARDLDYYERRTVRDSSLSACTQAVMCAEVGHLELAHAYAVEAALVDLRDLHNNTRDGLHMASLAGSWTALVEGFGGMRVHGETLSFDPALPDRIARLGVRLRWRGRWVHLEMTHELVTCAVHGEALSVQLAGEMIEITSDSMASRPLVRRRAMLPEPPQPPGRSPRRFDGEHPVAVTPAEEGSRRTRQI